MHYKRILDAECISDDLLLLEQTVRAAGQLALARFGTDLRIYYKDGKSPVTDVDLQIDRFLKEKLLKERPTYGWISEESNDTRNLQQAPEYSFLLDPIDGTRGFINNSDYWCISVAVIDKAGRPIYGCVYCPALNDYYAGSIFTDPYRNGEKLLPLPPINKQAKLRLSGSKDWIKRLTPLALDSVEVVGSLPSIACTLLALARGEIDMVLMRPTCKDWDLAGAGVILNAVGAVIADVKGNLVYYNHDSNHEMQRPLLAVNKSLLPDIENWLLEFIRK